MKSKNSASEAQKVVVRDGNFDLIKVIDEPIELKKFDEHWVSKLELQSNEHSRASTNVIKLDIFSGERSTRYLYDKEGFLRLLSKNHTPEFQIKDPVAFNKLLGLP